MGPIARPEFFERMRNVLPIGTARAISRHDGLSGPTDAPWSGDRATLRGQALAEAAPAKLPLPAFAARDQLHFGGHSFAKGWKLDAPSFVIAGEWLPGS